MTYATKYFHLYHMVAIVWIIILLLYGFHIISGSEGRKDPFSSLYKYKPHAPSFMTLDVSYVNIV